MRYLGSIRENRNDLDNAHNYFSQAYDLRTQVHDSEKQLGLTAQLLLDVHRVQARHGQQSNSSVLVSDSGEEDRGQDATYAFEELRLEMEQLQLEREEDEGVAERGLPWT